MAEVRDRILGAAIEAASIHGIGRMSVGDVARRAGLSRPTVYKHFPSKQDLLSAAVQHEAQKLLGAVLAAVDEVDDPREALNAGVRTALRLVREHPLLDRVVRTEPERLVPLLTTDDGLVLSVLRPPVEAVVAAKLGLSDPVVARRLADLLTRLLISYALNPPDDPPEVVADVLIGMTFDGVGSLVARRRATSEGRAR
jgi:AcrR family transcriptional regulator